MTDRVAIVTGSTTGIGEAIARRLVSLGWRVVIHGIEPELGEAVVGSLGSRAILSLGDLRDPLVPSRVVSTAVEEFGQLDAIVNNAGVCWRGDLESTDATFFDNIMAINARAPMLFCQAAMPYFRASGRGHIVNIGSIHAYQGGSSLLAYSMSKGALMTLTRSLANDFARQGVRTNQLNIGWTLTPNEYELVKSHGASENWPEELGKECLAFGRLYQPEEIAGAVAFLLSEDAALLNGAVIDFHQWNIHGRV